MISESESKYPSAATNPCKLCTPLGACLAFKGVAGTIPFLHGSQGCATYIRRYLISHFREPMDIAASNFSEQSAIFGGGANLKAGLANVLRQYQPDLVGLATTCLSETIGEDVPSHLREFAELGGSDPLPPIVPVSTASFRGTHLDGFHAAVRALVEALAENTAGDSAAPHSFGEAPVALFPGLVSAADLRELKRLARAVGVTTTLLPDYSETLDGPSWSDYEKLPPGGTPVEAIRRLPRARSAVECGRLLAGAPHTAGTWLAEKFRVPLHRVGLPVGLRETDRFLAALSAGAGANPALVDTPSTAGVLTLPPDIVAERGRLIDSWVDGHKYVFEKRAVLIGDDDLVIGLASFLTEIGVLPVLCASLGTSGRFAATLRTAVPEIDDRTTILEGTDHGRISEALAGVAPDLIIGSSKAYPLSRQLNVPLLRCGLPIHDRIGGQRVLHVGYAGAQALYDRIVNALLEIKQSRSPIGYSYL